MNNWDFFAWQKYQQNGANRRIELFINRAGHPADNPSQCWQQYMYYPFMNYYITELTTRLLENGDRYQAQYLIPMNLPRLTLDTVGVIGKLCYVIVHKRVVHVLLPTLTRVISGMTSSVDLSARSPWNSRRISNWSAIETAISNNDRVPHIIIDMRRIPLFQYD
jgi:hypothetical protein